MKMKRYAIFLVIVAIAATATDIYSIPVYLKLSSISWERIFRTERLHHYFMMALGEVVFGLIPGIVLICGGSARVIYNYLNDISDENRNA
jgi:hypothetical protein